ncbi:DNA-damage-inducible protein J [Weissella koreensis KACC 15510]|uniref:type II toxin-antitoxin system RelB/DinJ family antitoxin n=1 Tax=Weissella koreensis TaxID=165096 RepID=UPI0002175A65|nr:type II toxin-antitoxin system RelB/DinJ family antitoxin [Weissella koreensis]AEJ23595.1 DNA-damage-inducible protein J [Weissella koreensis KACC 15510]
MAIIPTTIRLNDELRDELEPRLKAVGLSLNDYLVMAAKQFVIQNKIPFEVIVPKGIPNETTHKALIEAQTREIGLIPDNSPEFDNVDDLINHLGSDN